MALGRRSIEALWQDLRQGFRALAARPGFTGLAVGTLVLCIGANVVVFTLVNALWLRPPPIADPDRVVMVTGMDLSDVSGLEERHYYGEGGLQILRRYAVFETVAGQVPTSGDNADYLPRLSIDRVGREVETIGVTSQYFAVMGLRTRGREFTEEDDRPGAAPVTIISDRLWRTAFRGASDVIGEVVAASPVPVRIVGVAPAGFQGVRLGEQADVWVPRHLVSRLSRAGQWKSSAGRAPPLLAFARLRSGVSLSEAQRTLELAQDPNVPAFARDKFVIPIRRLFGSPVGRTVVVQPQAVLWIATAMAALVLVAGAATLMALVLVQYERRRSELAIRMALGCSRARLMRSLVVELGGLSVVGATGAVAMAAAGLRVLPAFQLSGVDLGRLDLNPDGRALAFGVLVAVVTLAIAALTPLRRSTRPTLVADLASTSAKATASSLDLRRDILALHVAATVVLLVCSGLFVRTVVHGFTRSPGFDIDRTLFVEARVGSPYVSENEWKAEFADNVQRARHFVDRLRALPGVAAVSLGEPPHGVWQPRPWAFSSGTRLVNLTFSAGSVGPSYFEVLDVPLIAGRGFADASEQTRDTATGPASVVVTESFAHALWPGRSPVGERFTLAGSGLTDEVVGVVKDFALGSQRLDLRTGFFILTGYETAIDRRVLHVALHADDPERLIPSVRQTMAEIFPGVLRVDIATGREIDARELGRERLGAWFFSGFGLVALLLGVGGAFGLVAYVAESRRREMGIRLALGAMPGHIIHLVVSRGLWPVAVGTVSGLGVSVLVGRLVEAQLIGVSGWDPVTFGAVGTLMLGSAAAASLAAAWRLRRLSPSEVLRAE